MAKDRIGRYRITGRLGSGGTSEVYEGFDEVLNRPVAIKGLHIDRSGPERRERLRREALSVAALSHPAVAHVYEIVTEGERDWVVMEFVAGRSLADIAAAGPLPPAEVARIGEQVALALAAAHAGGIIHRDVKAENVMVTPDGRIKVLDFGFAKWTRPVAPSAAKLTADGVVVGTAQAMSPEQAMGRELDPRTDIFSLGSLLYELAAGRSPFRAATPLETMYRVARVDHVSLRRAAPQLPKALVAAIETCLEPDPRDRFASATALAAALHTIANPLNGELPATPVPRRRRLAAWGRRYWWVPVALALLVLVALLVRVGPAEDPPSRRVAPARPG
jgi:serine/threonine-protein kinase